MAGPKTPKHASTATSTTPASKPKASPAASTAHPATPPSAPASASAVALHTLWTAYLDATSSRLKFIDAFLVFLILSGVAQFVYCVLVTSFPFNAFLAG